MRGSVTSTFARRSQPAIDRTRVEGQRLVRKQASPAYPGIIGECDAKSRGMYRHRVQNATKFENRRSGGGPPRSPRLLGPDNCHGPKRGTYLATRSLWLPSD